MDKIKTPFGEIGIFIDGEEVEYKAESMELSIIGKKVDERYMIKVNRVEDSGKHIISCCIKDKPKDLEGEIESGENLELISFCRSEIRLSIGTEGDTWNDSRIFDYDVSYEKDGMSYIQNEDTKTEWFSFGICWISDYHYDEDVRTWYGADPSGMCSHFSIFNKKIAETFDRRHV